MSSLPMGAGSTALALLAALALLPRLVARLAVRTGHVQANFRGDVIPQSLGVVALVWCPIALAASALVWPSHGRTLCISAAVLVMFGLLGLNDDRHRDIGNKGLRGHIRALIERRQLTSGGAKLLLGLGAAAWAGTLIHPGRPLAIVQCCLLIALSANMINLLDLRPGRACGGFTVIAAVLLMWLTARGAYAALAPTASALAAAGAIWPRDGRALAMMGDVGSNLLGAAIGLSLCLSPLPAAAQWGAVAVLAAVHAAAERISFSTVIARSPLLSALDRLTGVRCSRP